jgi:hypothetical protein
MKKLLIICALLFAMTQAAHADVWKWLDALGKTHYVDTKKPIYTWVDEEGKVHYADQPGHEDAVSVQLVWYSKGEIDETAAPEKKADSGYAFPGETAEQRAERESAEAYYCKRATEVYESYLSAPQLYTTNEQGEREILSKEDVARTIDETRNKKNELCK